MSIRPFQLRPAGAPPAPNPTPGASTPPTGPVASPDVGEERPSFCSWTTAACHPTKIVRPTTLAQLQETIRSSPKVRAAGAGHSHNNGMFTDGTLIDMRGLASVVSIDKSTDGAGTVTVEAGCTLEALIEALAKKGLELSDMPTSKDATVGGVIATGAHGASLHAPQLSTDVVSMEVLNGKGQLMTLTSKEDLAAARLGLGNLGVTYRVTLKCVPLHNVRRVSSTVSEESAMASLKDDLAKNERATMAWFPNQRQIWRVFDNTTKDKADPVPGGEVGGVGWAFALARQFPFLQGVIPWAMSKYVSWFPEQGVYRSDQVDFRVPHLNTHALSTFVPVEKLPQALEAIRQVFEQHHYTPHMPVAIRFVAGDPSADLSPTRGKPCAVIEVFAEAHFPKETWEPTFKDVELALTQLGGHPHWAKGFIENPRLLYPQDAWDNYERLRHRMDPEGKFVNDWARGFLPEPAKSSL